MKSVTSAVTFAFGLCAVSTSSFASTVFSDTEFVLTNYTISQFPSGQAVTISTSLTGGNPGAAVQVDFVAGTGTSTSSIYFLSNQFLYNPATSGAIANIKWSSDGYITNTGGVGSYFQTLILHQGGNYYSFSQSIGATQGSYHTALANSLTSLNFTRVDNLSTDSALHPDFSGGQIQFGFFEGVTISNSSHAVARTDNFYVEVTSVPEPSTLAFMLFGLASFGLNYRQQIPRRGSR